MHAKVLMSLAEFIANVKQHLRSILYESACSFLGSSCNIKYLFVLKLFTTVLTMQWIVFIAMYDYFLVDNLDS